VARESLPERVSSFLHTHIDTVPQLETLLLLYTERAHDWAVDEVARRIYLQPPEVTSVLRHLQQHALVSSTMVDNETRFRYDGTWDRENEMEEILAAYRRQLIEVTRLIHGKASGSVLDFARAFDLKGKR
jgi:hypothetical protein